jgi:hypothetical protein
MFGAAAKPILRPISVVVSGVTRFFKSQLGWLIDASKATNGRRLQDAFKSDGTLKGEKMLGAYAQAVTKVVSAHHNSQLQNSQLNETIRSWMALPNTMKTELPGHEKAEATAELAEFLEAEIRDMDAIEENVEIERTLYEQIIADATITQDHGHNVTDTEPKVAKTFVVMPTSHRPSSDVTGLATSEKREMDAFDWLFDLVGLTKVGFEVELKNLLKLRFESHVTGHFGPLDIDLKMGILGPIGPLMDFADKIVEEAVMFALGIVEPIWTGIEKQLDDATKDFRDSVSEMINNLKRTVDESLKLQHCHGGMNIGWCKCGAKWQGGDGHTRWSCPRQWNALKNCGWRQGNRFWNHACNCGWRGCSGCWAHGPSIWKCDGGWDDGRTENLWAPPMKSLLCWDEPLPVACNDLRAETFGKPYCRNSQCYDH